VFVRSTKINMIISLLFVLSMGACSGLGGCGACGAAQPLPGGILPPNQTIEGGAQIRVTPQGFNKLTSILPGVINSGLGGGMCIPGGSVGGFALEADYCNTNGGGACGTGQGCGVTIGVHPGSFQINVSNANSLHFAVGLDVHSVVHLEGSAFGVGIGSCDMHVDGNNLSVDADISVGITQSNGELNIHVAHINNFDSSGLSLSNCGIISDLGNLVNDILNSFVGQFAIQLLTPVIDNLVQGFLPSPLGIAGLLDIGQLLQGVSPGTQASMEARIVPGGYANLVNSGMSLGVITGLNSDQDPTTRTGTRPDGVPFASEPALCVPPLPISDYSQAPYSLPQVARSAEGGNTSSLAPADVLNGSPDPQNADIIMGLSQTMLDLAGHHAVTSGAMCLGVGTSFVNQLNVGTIGILVPSLGDLASDSGNDPLLLVTRPQRALEFTIGDNTAASPALTIGISHLEVDFYAFLYERYVRAFTLDLSLNVGVNLTFMPASNGNPATIVPMLSGISSQNVTLKVLNSEFVKESPDKLEMVLPSVFDLVTPLLNIPPINVPTFAGFSLDNLAIQHVTTSQDDFLALTANLGAGAFARQLAAHDNFAAQAVHELDAGLGPVAAASTGTARLLAVHTPSADKVRGALLQQKDGELPSVTFDVDRYDSSGRELEWSWNLDGGIWRPFTSASPLVISDRAFAWQGKYTIGLMSRVKGDYKTTVKVSDTPVIIDSVGPRIAADKARFNDDDLLVTPVWDTVSGHAIKIAYGTPGSDKPATEWMTYAQSSLARPEFDKLARNGEIAMFATDEVGNQSIALIAPFHGTGNGQGCSCQTSGSTPGSGSLVLFGIVGIGALRRRRRLFKSRLAKNIGLWLLGSAVMSLVPGCSCSKNAAQSCEMDKDCGPCPKGQLPFCIDNTCVCSDDIVPGRIGPYSDVATAPDGSIWVSAYAQSHGDLVVTHATGGRIPNESWEWVDGVPDGPVVVPNSQIRGGIADDGPDVGMYTSIAVAPDGTPMVTYFDRDNSSLKFAAKVNGTWQTHVVDTGNGSVDAGGAAVGMYTSLSLRGDDGRPGVAYLAHVGDAMGGHAEVRYAAAQVPFPTSSADWQTWVVDTAPLPVVDANNPNIYPLPEGLGLFIDSARDPRNQAPVVAYYDRTNGDLKLARFNPQTGQFDAPKVLDGTMGDDGWSPTVTVDAAGVAHVAYVDATTDDLKYLTDEQNATPEIIDDGYRIVGQTVDGLPKPEFHFVGDDAGIVLPAGQQPYVVYQDSTTQELLLAQRQPNGMWMRSSIAGATDPWPGAYGFFAAAAATSTDLVMSTWVIDQPTEDNWVEVFTRPLGIM
jgi:MYXO-CTERM domain-containing protein